MFDVPHDEWKIYDDNIIVEKDVKGRVIIRMCNFLWWGFEDEK